MISTILCLCSFIVSAPVDSPKVQMENWRKFLPKGNTLDSMTTGDLNKDGLDDVVFVYQPVKTAPEQNDVRVLRILFAQPDGKYKLAAESYGATAPENMGYTFFTGLKIKKGVLTIEHEYLRGGCKHLYRYQNNGFYLIGASTFTGDPTYSESLEFNLSTGQYVYEYSNDDETSNSAKSRSEKGVLKLKTLPEISTYEIFSLEVAGRTL